MIKINSHETSLRTRDFTKIDPLAARCQRFLCC